MIPLAMAPQTHVPSENLHDEVLCVGCHTPHEAGDVVWYEDSYQFNGELTYGALPWCSFVCLLANWQMRGNA